MAFAPVLALAASAPDTSGITGLVTSLGNIIKSLIPVAFALAIIYFFYGVAKYILKAGDPKEAAAGKSIMIYGIIAIAVMASVYGLVAWLQNTLGVSATSSITLPTVPQATTQ